MGKKLYVGNLPYSVRDGDLEQAFGQFGSVTSAKVMMERDTGRSKGFGFVEMGSDEEAQSAINGMNGQPLGGRAALHRRDAQPEVGPRTGAPARVAHRSDHRRARARGRCAGARSGDAASGRAPPEISVRGACGTSAPRAGHR